MPAYNFWIKQGDTRDALERTLKDANGNVVNLTGCTVRFYMKNKSTGAIKVDAAATIVTPATDGKVRYQWQTADTDTAGDYLGEFEVTYGDGTKQTFPNARHLEIGVIEQIK